VKRLLAIVIVFSGLALTSSASAATYKSCATLNKKYKNGIAKSSATAKKQKNAPKVSLALYKSNIKLDIDKDGTACENLKKAKSPTTPSSSYVPNTATLTNTLPATTTTLPPVTMNTPVSDLGAFVTSYAQSVVTVSCAKSQGSGVSVPFAPTAAHRARGIQSYIITNEHVIFDCLSLTGETQMKVLFKGVEYVGYLAAYPSWIDVQSGAKPDLAAITTTALIPTSSYSRVFEPALGHAVVAVGSAGGVPNVTTKGEIAGVTWKKIITTAPAGHGSSGGGLFNNKGQLLGFITAANATLVEVTPITQMCEVVINCSSGGIFYESLTTGSPVTTVAPATTTSTTSTSTTSTSTTSTSTTTTTTTIPGSFIDGTKVLGVNFTAGRYATSTATSCYWERLRGFSGSSSDIIANSITSSKRVIVDVLSTDLGFKTTRCGTWTPWSAVVPSVIADGAYVVTSEIQPGLWSTTFSGSCYWTRLSSFNGSLSAILANDFTYTSAVVRILPTDVGFTSSGCGTWTKIG
jgi:hypothetical protein